MLKTKFRLTKCVWYQGTELEEIADTAITEDGKRHKIQKLSDGTEYFTIDNPYTDENNKSRYMFYGYIEDAIKAIREHYADCMISGAKTNVFNSGDYPIVLLDRKKGEEYWKQSVDGWEGTKFGYIIKSGDKNSFGGYSPLNENGESSRFNPKEIKYYNTREEAENKLNNWIKDTKEFVKGYFNTSEDKRDSYIRNSNFSFFNFCSILAEDMIDNPDITDLQKLPCVGFRIEQAIIPN